MKLYHLTNLTHLVEIENDGFLEVTESNIGAPYEVDGETLPPLIGVVIPDYDDDGNPTGELPESDPTHPNFLPTLMPREIWLDMSTSKTGAPRMIDPAEFALHCSRVSEMDPETGQLVMPSKVVVGFEPNSDNTPVLQPLEGPPEAVLNNAMAPTGKYGDHVGPDVVWLTDDPTPSQHWQALDAQPGMPYMFRKNIVLFTVEVPDEDLLHWPEWAREQGISEYWYDALDPDKQAEHWYCVPRRILKEEWVSIHNAETGSVYWTRERGHVEGDDRFSVPLPTYWVGASLQQVI